MKNTSIIDRYPDAIPALARGYRQEGAGYVIDETGWEQVGDGQVHSDIHDLALWDENFYTGKVGGRELVRADVRGGPAELRSSPPATPRGSTSAGVAGPHLGDARRLLGRLPLEPHSRAGRALLRDRAVQPRGGRRWRDGDGRRGDLPGGQAWPGRARRGRGGDRSPSPRRGSRSTCRDYAGAYFSEEADARCVLDERGGALVLETCARRPGPEARQDRRVRRGRQFPDSPVRDRTPAMRTVSSTGRPACAACRSVSSRSRSSEIPANRRIRGAACGAGLPAAPARNRRPR